MKQAYAATGKKVLAAGGWYTRRLRHDRFPGVAVLCYHGIRTSAWRRDEAAFANLHMEARRFEAHCRVLAESCHPISLGDWRAAARGERTLPDRPVLVTFDDGYRSVWEVARPILRRHAIPAAIFVCTEPIERGELFWFDAVARAAGEQAAAAMRLLEYGEWQRASSRHRQTAAAADPLAPLTVDQLRQLADEGFEVGVHTVSHGRLSGATREQQWGELEPCRQCLDTWLGGKVSSIAYPWGAPREDYTEETLDLAKGCGFEIGLTTRPDFARPEEPALERSRFLVLSEVSSAELAHRLAHAWPR